MSAIQVNVEEAKVKLSFQKYLEGSGILKELSVKGVNGVIDSSMVEWDYSKEYPKMTWQYGDFDMERVQVEELHVDFLVPYYHSPLTLAIFNMEADRLRRQWFLFDVLSASCIRGSFLNCLFNFQRVESPHPDKEYTTSTLKMDGLPIDVVTGGSSGPLSWLTSGYVENVLCRLECFLISLSLSFLFSDLWI
jgi:distribution and morphology protein 31